MKEDQPDLAAPPAEEEWEGEKEHPRGRLRFLLVPLAVIIVIGAVVWLMESQGRGSGLVGQSQAVTIAGTASGPAPKVGSPAPDFTLSSLEGQAVSLSSFRGKVVLLNFFATWCPPCRAEMPDLQATYREMKERGLEIVAVDLQEDRGTVADYVKSLGLTFTILLDRDAKVFGQYRITGLPTTYFIDRDGGIRELAIGALNKTILRQKLNKLF